MGGIRDNRLVVTEGIAAGDILASAGGVGPAGPAGPCEPSKQPVNRTEADSATMTLSPRMRMLRNVGESGGTQRQSFEQRRRI